MLVEHSTPYSGHSLVTVRPRRLPVISPLVIAESPLKPNEDQFDSPNLFPDISEEHCDPSANESNRMCTTANENGAGYIAANTNGDVHSSANENKDERTTANEMRDSCTAKNAGDVNVNWTSNESSDNDLGSKNHKSNSSIESSLKLVVKLQNVLESDAHNISDKKKSLSLNEDDSTKNNSESAIDIPNRSNECTATPNLSAENMSSNGHVSPKVLRGEGDSDLAKISCTCTEYEDFDNSVPKSRNLSTRKHEQSLGKLGDVSGENIKNLSKNQAQNISTITVEHASTGHISQDISPTSEKDGSKVLEDEMAQDANTINTHREDTSRNPKPAHSADINAMSEKLAGLRLLDAKVYLNKDEGLMSSSSVAAKSSLGISAPQNSSGSADVNGVPHGSDLQDLPAGKIHPPNFQPENDVPPLLTSDYAHSPLVSESELPALSTSKVHPPKSTTSSEPPQHSLNGNRFPEEGTPEHFDICTPLTRPSQHSGSVFKNPNYSSFVVRAISFEIT